jgi:hypothetical protein
MIWIPILSLIAGGGFHLLKNQYIRIQCTQESFESTRNALTRQWQPSNERIQKNESGVTSLFWCGGKHYRLRLKSLSSSGGFIFIPMMMILGILCVGSLTLNLLYLRYLRSVETQLKLDSCVVELSKRTVKTLNEFERINNQIPLLRASVIATKALPAANTVARALLVAANLRQKWLQTEWYMQAPRFIQNRDCNLLSPKMISFFEFPYQAEPPDPIGPNPYLSKADHFPIDRGKIIHVFKKRRKSCAEVFYDSEKKRWKSEWVNQC